MPSLLKRELYGFRILGVRYRSGYAGPGARMRRERKGTDERYHRARQQGRGGGERDRVWRFLRPVQLAVIQSRFLVFGLSGTLF